MPRRPQKPPKVELQTVQRACVYYARGGFHPGNCTGCFSGPDRVNSSSCALPAGEACIYVCACVHESVHVSEKLAGLSRLCAAEGVELTEQLSPGNYMAAPSIHKKPRRRRIMRKKKGLVD